MSIDGNESRGTRAFANIQLTVAALAYAGDQLRVVFEIVANTMRMAFAEAINFLAVRLEALVNTAIDQFNRLLRVSMSGIALGRVEAEPSAVQAALTWSQAWEGAGAAVAEQGEVVQRFFDQSTEAARDLLGLTQALSGEIDSSGTAVERLNRLIEEQLAKREALAAANRLHPVE